LIKFKLCQIYLNLFKRVQSNSLFTMNSLFIQPNYRPIRLIIRQIRPIFVFSKNSCSFHSSNIFRSIFPKFFRIFLNFVKCDVFNRLRIFCSYRIFEHRCRAARRLEASLQCSQRNILRRQGVVVDLLGTTVKALMEVCK
jgi:hypothetical protein